MTNSAKSLDSSLTVLSILKDKPVTINNLSKQNVNDVRAALILIINDGAKLLAEYKRPKPDMVLYVVNLIIDKYSHLAIDDIKLCMNNLYTGVYGEIIALDIERYGKALFTYSEEKRLTAISYNPPPSNQFPRERDRKKPCPMPEHIRELLKKDIGYVNTKKEEAELKSRLKINWKEKIPSLTDEEVQIYEYFDEKWHEQGNKLKAGSVNPVIEYDGTEMTRGQFVHEAKKRISNSKTV